MQRKQVYRNIVAYRVFGLNARKLEGSYAKPPGAAAKPVAWFFKEWLRKFYS
jgi:hypothetical protein